MIELKKWHGRLGNNIIQLQNVLHIALYYKEPVEICKHKHFHLYDNKGVSNVYK